MTSRPWLVIAISVFVSILFTTGLFLLKGERRIAYVDSARIINGYNGMKKARANYQQKILLMRSRVDTLVTEIQRELQQYEKRRAGMSVKESEISKKLIDTKQKQLADYQQSVKEKAADEDKQMTRQVIDEINRYVKEYGKKNNYAIILVANDFGTIAYAQEDMDITDEVLKGLNGN